MNIIDVIIILIILCGAVVGLKRGVLNELVMTVGFLLVFVISYFLKNPVAEFLSLNLPFFNFGSGGGSSVALNIIFYQIISFVIVFCIVMFLFRILLSITGFIEKILKFTIILGIPSKILGFIVGAVEGYILAFLFIFALNQPILNIDVVNQSKLKEPMLTKTPVLTNLISNVKNTVDDVFVLTKDSFYSASSPEFNLKAIDIMLKHKMITVNYVEDLVDYGKINISGINDVLNNYR